MSPYSAIGGCFRLFRVLSPLLTWIQIAGSSGQVEILQCWVKLQRAWGFFGAVYIVWIDNLFYFLYVCVCVHTHGSVYACVHVLAYVCGGQKSVLGIFLIVFYLICWGRVSHLNPELLVSPMLFLGAWPRTLWWDLLASLSQGALFTSWVLFSHLSWMFSSATPLGNAFSSFTTGKRLPCSLQPTWVRGGPPQLSSIAWVFAWVLGVLIQSACCLPVLCSLSPSTPQSLL